VSISGEESQTAKLVMAYIFTILNSLQGLFIFIFHCILNDKVNILNIRESISYAFLLASSAELILGISNMVK